MDAYGSRVAVHKNELSHLARDFHDDFNRRLDRATYFVIHFGKGERLALVRRLRGAPGHKEYAGTLAAVRRTI
jgi:hypothetical protein